MSMKKSDLDKRLGNQIEGRIRAAGTSGRFGQGSAAASGALDRREQRRLDAEAGLVPFACKLPGDLAATLRERAATHAEGLNGVVAELLRKALG